MCSTQMLVKIYNNSPKVNFIHFNFRKMDQLLECSALLTECMTSHFAESEAKLFSLPMDPSATNSVQVKYTLGSINHFEKNLYAIGV